MFTKAIGGALLAVGLTLVYKPVLLHALLQVLAN